MIYALTLHIAIDRYINTDNLVVNETNYYHNQDVVVGGKSVNVCKIINEFSKDYKLVSTTDLDNLKLVNDELKDINKELFIDSKSRVNYKINNNGVITELNQKVPALDDKTKAELFDYLIKNVSQNDYLLIAGSISIDNIQDIKMLCKTINTNNIIIDSNAFSYDDLMEIKPLMIKPNEEEIDKIITDKMSVNDKINKLINGGIKEVILTSGSKGVSYNNQDFVKPESGEVVNTVGAGDSFVGGYLVSKIENKDIKSTIKFAQACGSATAYSKDIAKKNDILELYNR